MEDTCDESAGSELFRGPSEFNNNLNLVYKSLLNLDLANPKTVRMGQSPSRPEAMASPAIQIRRLPKLLVEREY